MSFFFFRNRYQKLPKKTMMIGKVWVAIFMSAIKFISRKLISKRKGNLVKESNKKRGFHSIRSGCSNKAIDIIRCS